MTTPFLVLGLPRSRTAWLARFLSYREWHCGHEEMRHMRDLHDVKAWFSQSFTGSAETAAAPFWRLIPRYCPEIRIVTVRRPVKEVVASLLRLDQRNAPGFNHQSIFPSIQLVDRKLDQIETRLPKVLSVSFADLAQEETCAKVFEHCLPYRHDRAWWSSLESINIQCDMRAMSRYALAYRSQLEKLAAVAKQAILTDLWIDRPVHIEGMTLQKEGFESFFRDGQNLFKHHLADVGENPETAHLKNIDLMRKFDELGCMQIITARSNGRMFGYVMSVKGPTFERAESNIAVQTTFYSSPDGPHGLGLKLQRASLAELKSSGIDEVFFRAGPRGSGPKMGALYRRLGAQDDGQMFRLSLKD